APPAEASGTACIPLSPVHDVSGSGRAARGARRPVAVVGPPHRAGLVSPRRLPRQPVRDAGGRGACHSRAGNRYAARRTDPAAHPPPVLWILLQPRELLLLLRSPGHPGRNRLGRDHQHSLEGAAHVRAAAYTGHERPAALSVPESLPRLAVYANGSRLR